MAGGKMRIVKRRIKSVKNTHQITKAMEMVSSSKFKKFQRLVGESRPYSDGIENILRSISFGIKDIKTPLLQGKKDIKKVGIVVITSDRGLCGSYNNAMIKEMNKFIERQKEMGRVVSVIAIGKKIRDYCRKNEIDMKGEYIQLIPETMFEKAQEIGEQSVDFFEEDLFDEVHLLYSKFISAVTSKITMKRLLPLEQVKVEGNENYLFEPSEEQIMDSLLPKYLNIALYQAILEATASEHSARMKAMKSASDNAIDMIGKLTLVYNRARQASITQEISEIVAGADALK